MSHSKLSEKVTITVAFLSGVIFSNAVTSLIDGNYVLSLISFLTVITAFLIKRFVDWGYEEEE